MMPSSCESVHELEPHAKNDKARNTCALFRTMRKESVLRFARLRLLASCSSLQMTLCLCEYVFLCYLVHFLLLLWFFMFL